MVDGYSRYRFQDFTLPITAAGSGAGNCIGGWGEYGRLWVLLNPFFYTQPSYAYNLLVVQILAVLPQLWLVKKGRLSRNLVYFNIFTSFLFRAGYSAQDVTTTVFAPLASINPLFTLLFVFQKMALGWGWLGASDFHWSYMNYLTGFEPFVWLYGLLVFWAFVPVIIWMRNTFFKERFHWKIPAFKLRKGYDERSFLLWSGELAVLAFFFIDHIINGGYILQFCHPWQLGTKGFDQCNTWITLPLTSGWNFQVMLGLVAGSVILGMIDILVRRHRQNILYRKEIL